MFSWNYTTSVNILNNERIPGYWRGIYRWFYDTDTPHTTPWEMLGVSVKPNWWDNRYGEAPILAVIQCFGKIYVMVNYILMQQEQLTVL